MRQTTLIKLVVGLAAIAVFGVLFIRSARNVGAEPYTVNRAHLAGWTVVLDPEPRTSGVLVALMPPAAFAPPLFGQVFTRSGLSLSGPNPVAMPLVLQGEFERSLTGVVTPEALVELARESGVESMQPRPLCMASRRVSEPGSTRQVFFVRFEQPAFQAFRRRLAERVGAANGSGVTFESDNLTPVVIVAASDAGFGNWLPLTGSGTQDCLAPMVVQ